MVAVSAEHTPGGGLGRAHLFVVSDGSASSLDVAASAMIAHGAAVQTDGWRGYAGLTYEGYEHRARALRSADEIDAWLPWSHVVRSNFKRWMLDIFHGVARLTCRPTWMSTATGSTGVSTAPTSSVAYSIAAWSTPPRRPTQCSRQPERRG
jgi:hypothetical protein